MWWLLFQIVKYLLQLDDVTMGDCILHAVETDDYAVFELAYKHQTRLLKTYSSPL